MQTNVVDQLDSLVLDYDDDTATDVTDVSTLCTGWPAPVSVILGGPPPAPAHLSTHFSHFSRPSKAFLQLLLPCAEQNGTATALNADSPQCVLRHIQFLNEISKFTTQELEAAWGVLKAAHPRDVKRVCDSCGMDADMSGRIDRALSRAGLRKWPDRCRATLLCIASGRPEKLLHMLAHRFGYQMTDAAVKTASDALSAVRRELVLYGLYET